MPHDLYRACIDACNDCATACSHCAVTCLQEHDCQSMARCIASGMDCAPTCHLAAAAMARGSEQAQAFCTLCADVCQACADECAKHAHDHCRRCAEACLHCAEECRSVIQGASEIVVLPAGA